MLAKSPFANIVAAIRDRETFSHSGLWTDWWHHRKVYAVFFNALHLPVAAWMGGKWYYAVDLNAQPFAGLLAERLDDGTVEVIRVTSPELSSAIHTGEPPVPPEVKALLSVCPD